MAGCLSRSKTDAALTAARYLGNEPGLLPRLVRSRAGAIKNCREHRRHLNATQRAFLALEIEKIEAERAKERMAAGGAKGGAAKGTQKIADALPDAGEARAIAAKAVGANHSYVSAATRKGGLHHAKDIIEDDSASQSSSWPRQRIGFHMSIEDFERTHAIARGRAEDEYAIVRSLWQRLDELPMDHVAERKKLRSEIMAPSALSQSIIDADDAKIRLAIARASDCSDRRGASSSRGVDAKAFATVLE
jgi:hypothetical protein